jgi:quinol monooxygenase YgiN
MTTPTDQNRSLLTVLGLMRAKAGKEGELREVLESIVEPTHHDQGMVTYNLHQGVVDKAQFCFYENWESEELLKAHLDAPHFKALGVRLEKGDLLDGELTVLRLGRIGK